MENSKQNNGSSNDGNGVNREHFAAPAAPPGEENVTTWPEAYSATLPDMVALPREALVSSQGVDVPAAIALALKALPHLRAMQTEYGGRLPGFDVAQIDRLERYAAALAHAHSMYLAADTSTAVASLAAEASELRETLKQDTASLVRHRVLDRMPVLSGLTGYRNVAYDLNALHQTLLGHWQKIEGKTPLPYSDVLRAGTLSAKLVAMAAGRDGILSETSEAFEMRVRAYTLFFQTYEQLRRVVGYARWFDGDAAEIMPSVYTTRGPRRSTRTEAAEPQDETAVTRSPTPTPPPIAPGASTSTLPSGHDGPFTD